MLRTVFIDEGTELLEQVDKEDYEAVISILVAYVNRKKNRK